MAAVLPADEVHGLPGPVRPAHRRWPRRVSFVLAVEVVTFCERIEAERGSFMVDVVFAHGRYDRGGELYEPTTSHGRLLSWRDRGDRLEVTGVVDHPAAHAGCAVSWSVATWRRTDELEQWNDLSILAPGSRGAVPGAEVETLEWVPPEQLLSIHEDTRQLLERQAS